MSRDMGVTEKLRLSNGSTISIGLHTSFAPWLWILGSNIVVVDSYIRLGKGKLRTFRVHNGPTAIIITDGISK